MKKKSSASPRLRVPASGSRSLSSLRARLREAEEALRAIREGEVDAVIVKGSKGEQVYSLSGAETIYRQAAETMAEAVIAFAPDGQIVFANPRLAEFVGLPPERILGCRFEEFLQPESRAQFAGIMSRAEAGPLRERLVMRDASGRPRPVQVSASTIHTDDAIFITMVATDLTEIERVVRQLERTTAEQEAMREYAQRLNSILANAAVGFAVTTADGRFADANPAYCRIVGYDIDELRQFRFGQLVHPDDRAENERIAGRLLSGEGTDAVVENRYVRKDGQAVWVRKSISIARDAAGAPQGHIVFVEDITKRKQAEQALLESEAKAGALVRYAPTGIYEIDLKGKRFITVNDAVCRTLGYTRTELLAVSPFDVLDGESRARFAERVRRALSGSPIDEAVEYRVLRKDGKAVDAVLYVTISSAGDRALVVAHDVTERRQAERNLQDAMAELKRSNEELEQFAYVASHDLQEPLRMVSNYVDLLRQRYQTKLDQQADKYIEYASGGARRMQELISDLLTFSRVGRRELKGDPVDLNHAYQRALANLDAAISEAGAEVTSGKLPTVPGDELTLVQVFQNLIENAVKFHGKEPPRVRVGAEPTEEGWKLSVADNGIGIEPRHADRVFRLFQRLHTVDEYPGTGIGLAVCKRVVERHGGRIWIESAPGRGTTFYFTLPRVR